MQQYIEKQKKKTIENQKEIIDKINKNLEILIHYADVYTLPIKDNASKTNDPDNETSQEDDIKIGFIKGKLPDEIKKLVLNQYKQNHSITIKNKNCEYIIQGTFAKLNLDKIDLSSKINWFTLQYIGFKNWFKKRFNVGIYDRATQQKIELITKQEVTNHTDNQNINQSDNNDKCNVIINLNNGTHVIISDNLQKNQSQIYKSNPNISILKINDELISDNDTNKDNKKECQEEEENLQQPSEDELKQVKSILIDCIEKDRDLSMIQQWKKLNSQINGAQPIRQQQEEDSFEIIEGTNINNNDSFVILEKDKDSIQINKTFIQKQPKYIKDLPRINPLELDSKLTDQLLENYQNIKELKQEQNNEEQQGEHELPKFTFYKKNKNEQNNNFLVVVGDTASDVNKDSKDEIKYCPDFEEMLIFINTKEFKENLKNIPESQQYIPVYIPLASTYYEQQAVSRAVGNILSALNTVIAYLGVGNIAKEQTIEELKNKGMAHRHFRGVCLYIDKNSINENKINVKNASLVDSRTYMYDLFLSTAPVKEIKGCIERQLGENCEFNHILIGNQLSFLPFDNNSCGYRSMHHGMQCLEDPNNPKTKTGQFKQGQDGEAELNKMFIKQEVENNVNNVLIRKQ